VDPITEDAMRRAVVAGTIALVLVSALVSAAQAGGAVFEFEREYYQPGDRVVGRVTFGRGSGEPIRADSGPFIAYLMKGNTYIDAPQVPDGAIPVGPMTITHIDSGTWLARMEFTLPEVPPGGYSIGYCNDPCTSSSLGELMGGWFDVLASGQDVSNYLLRERLEQATRSFRHRIRAADRQVSALEGQLGMLRDENRRLEVRVAGLERASKSEPLPTPGFPAPIGWILVALTVLFGLVAFRPRRRGALSPDPPTIERIEDPDREMAIRG
jgi:hypothetical protein